MTLCSPIFPRAASFVTARLGLGFTAPFLEPPCLRRHLTQCSPHRHGVEHSLSFGPSPVGRLCSLPTYCRVGGGAQ